MHVLAVDTLMIKVGFGILYILIKKSQRSQFSFIDLIPIGHGLVCLNQDPKLRFFLLNWF